MYPFPAHDARANFRVRASYWHERLMAEKINPFAFLQQVRAEATKIVWPSRRETTVSTVMVIAMAFLAPSCSCSPTSDQLGHPADPRSGRRQFLRQGGGAQWKRSGTSSRLPNFERKWPIPFKEKAHAAGLGDLFEEILVPTEKVVEVPPGPQGGCRAQVLPRLRAGEDGDDR